jgi:hypothetical protein
MNLAHRQTIEEIGETHEIILVIVGRSFLFSVMRDRFDSADTLPLRVSLRPKASFTWLICLASSQSMIHIDDIMGKGVKYQTHD